MDALNDLILQAAASPWLLLVMFAVAALDGLFPPVPSETVLVSAAAVAVSSGNLLALIPLCLAATAGAALGDNLAYLVGRRVGTTRVRWMQGPRIARALGTARRGLDRRGSLFVLTARFIPVGRVAVNVAAGALHYPRRRFVPLTIVAGLLWSVYSAGIGALAGHWLADRPLLGAVLGTALAVTLGLVIDRIAAARSDATRPAGPEASAAPVAPSAFQVPSVSRVPSGSRVPSASRAPSARTTAAAPAAAPVPSGRLAR